MSDLTQLPPVAPDSNCRRHGRHLHALVHEAGHAVIAAHHSIEFASVSVARDSGVYDPSFAGTVAGGLDMGRLPHVWVPEDPARALEMLAAGYGAEREVLDDHLAKGFEGDLMILRWGTGLTGAHGTVRDGIQAVEDALGEPTSGVLERSRALVAEHRAQVIAIAAAIHASPGWCLTYDEVTSLLDLEVARGTVKTALAAEHLDLLQAVHEAQEGDPGTFVSTRDAGRRLWVLFRRRAAPIWHSSAPWHGTSPWAAELEARGLLELDVGMAKFGLPHESAAVAEEYYLGLTDAGRAALRST